MMSLTPQTPPGRALILLVEDDAAIRRAVSMVFEAHPEYELITAVDGETGLDKARDRRPDLVLMDLMLPNMDGFEAARAIQAHYLPTGRPVPILALTALRDDQAFERGTENGIWDFLTKPVHPRLLLEKVASYLADSRDQR